MKIHKRSTPETRQRLILNWKLAVGSLVLLTVLGLSGVIIRNVQVERVKSALGERADELSKQDNWREATTVLESLLQLDPTNPEIKVR